MKIIETERLILRTWKDGDEQALYFINQDLKVLEFLRGPLTIEQIKDFIARMNQQFEKLGYTLWAVEEKSSGHLIGFIGLTRWEDPLFCTEIGWRLGSEYWGKGLATEGAKAVLEYGFKNCELKEIVSFTVLANLRSIRVMEKIGMKRDIGCDFHHPKLPKDHPLSLHVLYRAKNEIHHSI